MGINTKLRESLKSLLLDANALITKVGAVNKSQRIKLKYSCEEANDFKSCTSFFSPYTDFNAYRWNDNFKVIKQYNSFKECINLISQVLNLKENLRRDNQILSGDELFSANVNFWESELITLITNYKELDQNTSITIDKYVEIMLSCINSNILFTQYKCQLFNFRLNVKKLEIGNFILKNPNKDEMDELMNNLSQSKKYDHCELAVGSDDNFANTNIWMSSSRVDRKPELSYSYIPLTFGLWFNDHLSEISNEIDEVLLILRLFKAKSVGIRKKFIRSSFTEDSLFYSTWTERRYKYGDYGKNINNQTCIINEEDVDNLENLVSLYAHYKENQIEQIDKALRHFSSSFEWNFEWQSFTDLIIAIESLLNDFARPNDNSIKRKIVSAESNNQADKVLKSINGANNAKKIASKISKLLSDDKLGNFFFDSEKTPTQGVFPLRNKMLHGNIGFDTDEIKVYLPELRNYVKDLLIVLFTMIVKKDVVCNSENYHKKLNEYLEI